MSGKGIDAVPKLPKRPVPVLMSYRSYRTVRYRYESLYGYRRYRYSYRTELTEVSGTGIDVVPKLPNYPVPVSMSYRSYRTVRYRLYRRYTSVRAIPNTPLVLGICYCSSLPAPACRPPRRASACSCSSPLRWYSPCPAAPLIWLALSMLLLACVFQGGKTDRKGGGGGGKFRPTNTAK